MIGAIAAAVGVAAALAVLAASGWLRRRWETDAAWIRQTAARFRPEPIDVRLWTLIYQAGRLGVLLLYLLLMPGVLGAILLWLATLMLPRYVVEFAWHQRRARIDGQLPGVIADMANSARAGLSIIQSIQRLAEQAPEPIRTELRVMSSQWAHGAALETVMEDTRARLRLPNFTLFTTAILVNREMGGDIVRVLDRLSLSLRRHEQLRKQIKAATSEGRTNIKMLVFAPVLLLLMMSSVDAEGVNLLFTTMPGLILLSIAFTMIALGVWWGARIVGSEV